MDKETEKAMKKEFRELKSYWISRLCTKKSIESWGLEFKKFEKIIFKNGYKKNAPSSEIELKNIEISLGIDTPIGKGDFFVIHLGEIIK